MNIKRRRRAKKVATLSIVRSMTTNWRRSAGKKRTSLRIRNKRNVRRTDSPLAPPWASSTILQKTRHCFTLIGLLLTPLHTLSQVFRQTNGRLNNWIISLPQLLKRKLWQISNATSGSLPEYDYEAVEDVEAVADVAIQAIGQQLGEHLGTKEDAECDVAVLEYQC